MKNVIEQIRKIKGVVTVEKAGENMAVVVFEPKKQLWQGRQYVKCTTENEFEFVKNQNSLNSSSPFGDWAKYPCICVNGTDIFSSEAFPERECRVIGFDTYLLLFLLGDKWSAFNKPKSLTPEELVDGKIYVDEANGRIVRFNKIKNKCTISLYSQKCVEGTYYSSINGYGKSYHCRGSFRPATPSEAQTLIRAEVANDFFFELK